MPFYHRLGQSRFICQLVKIFRQHLVGGIFTSNLHRQFLGEFRLKDSAQNIVRRREPRLVTIFQRTILSMSIMVSDQRIENIRVQQSLEVNRRGTG